MALIGGIQGHSPRHSIYFSKNTAELRLRLFVGIGFAVVKVLFRIILRGKGKL